MHQVLEQMALPGAEPAAHQQPTRTWRADRPVPDLT